MITKTIEWIYIRQVQHEIPGQQYEYQVKDPHGHTKPILFIKMVRIYAVDIGAKHDLACFNMSE